MKAEVTISKGEPWERSAPGRVSPITSRDDADAATKAFDALGRENPATLVLNAGDLLKTLGYESTPHPAKDLVFGMDLGTAQLDNSKPVPFVSHVLCHHRFWGAEFLIAMNGAWVGERYFGPKAHPNDGLLDITVGSLGIVQRLLFMRRAKLGTHLPHPSLVVKRESSFDQVFEKPVPVYIDGVLHRRATRVSLALRPDAFWVYC